METSRAEGLATLRPSQLLPLPGPLPVPSRPARWPASPACPSDGRCGSERAAVASPRSTRPGRRRPPSAGPFPTRTLRGDRGQERRSLGTSGSESAPGGPESWRSKTSPGTPKRNPWRPPRPPARAASRTPAGQVGPRTCGCSQSTGGQPRPTACHRSAAAPASGQPLPGGR